jgi:hypothetical protein
MGFSTVCGYHHRMLGRPMPRVVTALLILFAVLIVAGAPFVTLRP